ncbi:MAG: energy transducer TonB [Deltaproteobacteria bacterium]|nr:energy transducer TonB [Deltaproteobacteria bacterium]
MADFEAQSSVETSAFRKAMIIAVVLHAAVIGLILFPKQADSFQPLATMDFDVYDPLGGEPGGEMEAPPEEPEPEPEFEPEPEPELEEPPDIIESTAEEAEPLPPPPPPLPPEEKPKQKPKPKPTPAPQANPNPGPPAAGPGLGGGPGTGQGGSGGGTGKGNANALGAYKAKVQRKLERYKKYPPRARSDRQEGTATVRFTINRSGQVVNYSLVSSSGHAILDDEVLALLRRVNPFPEFPPEIPDSTLTLTAPIQFSLR